jgi:hypothetical protein
VSSVKECGILKRLILQLYGIEEICFSKSNGKKATEEGQRRISTITRYRFHQKKICEDKMARSRGME